MPQALASLLTEVPRPPAHDGDVEVHPVACRDGAAAQLSWARGEEPTLRAETERLRWLDGRAGAPAVVAHGYADGLRYLVTEPLQIGEGPSATADAAELRVVGFDVAGAVGAALRALHDLPAGDCPFSRSPEELLDEARRRVGEGAVRAEALSPPYRRFGPAGLLDLLERSRPPAPELAVVHGDFGLARVVVSPEGAPRLRSVHRLGVGDPHLDVAAACRELVTGYGPEVLASFAAAYGGESIRADRLDYHAMLIELL